MTRPRGYVCSWYFPPDVGSAAIDIFKRLKGCRADFEIFQVASRRRDAAILEHNGEAGFHRVESSADHERPREAANRARFVEEAARRFEAGNWDFILSHSNETVSHAAAIACRARRPDVPWIAYFGDVVRANPYIKYLPPLEGFTEDCAIEAHTIENADIVLCNNDYQRRLMFSGVYARFEHKALVVPHCYDPTLYGDDRRPGGGFVMRHVGSTYDVKRLARPVLEAVDLLLRDAPNRKGRFALHFHGNFPHQEDQAALARMAHQDHVRFEGPVGYLESLRLMRHSDALLLIDGVFDDARDGLAFSPYFPGKLADYLGARRPILGVTMPNGPTADILRSSKNLIATDDPQMIAGCLAQYLDGAVTTDVSGHERFSIETVAPLMEQVIDAALSRLAPSRK